LAADQSSAGDRRQGSRPDPGSRSRNRDRQSPIGGVRQLPPDPHTGGHCGGQREQEPAEGDRVESVRSRHRGEQRHRG